MTEVINILPKDETFVSIVASPSVHLQLNDAFSNFADGHRFVPSFKEGWWDGKIRHYNIKTRQIYKGLIFDVADFANSNSYLINVDPILVADFKPLDISDADFDTFIKGLNLSRISDGKVVPIEQPHDFQVKGLRDAIRLKRRIFKSATGSGKSLIIYMICRYMLQYPMKILITVPTIGLVTQMKKDFEAYSHYNGWSADENVHQIFEGATKVSDKPIILSTWQSIFKQSPDYFNQFDAIIGDECHQVKADCIKGIFEKNESSAYRLGFTGTLDSHITSQLTTKGLIGPVTELSSSADLMERGLLANLHIFNINLKYPTSICKAMKGKLYEEEYAYVVENPDRNEFLCHLASNLKGNTLLLVNRVEDHAEPLYEMLSKVCSKPAFLVTGQTDAEDRENVRTICEKSSDSNVVATYGVFSTGINIVNLHNIILASPFKAKIKILQSIGRGLRVSDTKKDASVYDVVDNLCYKKHHNHLFKHFIERTDIYRKEGFKFSISDFELKTDQIIPDKNQKSLDLSKM